MSSRRASEGFEAAAFRGARLPSALTLVAASTGFGLAKGAKGILGALVGGTIAIAFFAIHLLVSRLTRRADPAYVLGYAFTSYLAKILVLTLFLVAFAGTTSFDRIAFATTTITVSLAWLAGEVTGYFRRG